MLRQSTTPKPPAQAESDPQIVKLQFPVPPHTPIAVKSSPAYQTRRFYQIYTMPEKCGASTVISMRRADK